MMGVATILVPENLTVDDPARTALVSAGVHRIDAETAVETYVASMRERFTVERIAAGWAGVVQRIILGEVTEDELYDNHEYLRVFGDRGRILFDSMRHRNASFYRIDGALVAELARERLAGQGLGEMIEHVSKKYVLDGRSLYLALNASRFWFPQVEFEEMRSRGVSVETAVEEALRRGFDYRAVRRMAETVYRLRPDDARQLEEEILERRADLPRTVVNLVKEGL